MSRADGKFPVYERLDLDKEKFRADYWDASRMCEVCETRWPTNEHFEISPCCGSNTVLDTTKAPDMRWSTAVERLLQFRFNQWYEEWDDGTTDEQLAYSPDMIEEEVADFRQSIEVMHEAA